MSIRSESALGETSDGTVYLDLSQSSRLVARAGASEHADAQRRMEEIGVPLEDCPGCGACLDVSLLMPLDESLCPACGGVFVVMRRLDQFELMERMGKGGMGVVYRALDHTLKREVALKVLSSKYRDDPRYLEHLRTEALMTAQVSHRNVVRVFSAGLFNGRYYLAMEVVGGGTVADRLKEERSFPEAEALTVALQAARGLNAALHCGLLHRDVKPANLMYATDGTVKVVDFGLALSVEEIKARKGDVLGTPYYVAPEKLAQRGEDARSDIYSLGATLFQLLTGRRPFEAATVQALAEAHWFQRAPSVLAYNPRVSVASARVVMRMLLKNPAERYADYLELITDLELASSQVAREQGLSRVEDMVRQQEALLEVRRSAEYRLGLVYFCCLVVCLAAAVWMLLPRRGTASVVKPMDARSEPARGMEVFSQSFRRALDKRWVSGVPLRVVGGELRLSDADGMVSVAEKNWGNYSVEAQVRVLSGGLIMWFWMAENGDAQGYEVRANGEVTFVSRSGGRIERGASVQAPPPGTVTVGVRLVAREKHSQLLINGVVRGDDRLAAAGRGPFGIQAVDAGNVAVRRVQVVAR